MTVIFRLVKGLLFWYNLEVFINSGNGMIQCSWLDLIFKIMKHSKCSCKKDTCVQWKNSNLKDITVLYYFMHSDGKCWLNNQANYSEDRLIWRTVTAVPQVPKHWFWFPTSVLKNQNILTRSGFCVSITWLWFFSNLPFPEFW